MQHEGNRLHPQRDKKNKCKLMEKSSPLVTTFRKQRNTVEWKIFNITVEHLESKTVGVEGPVSPLYACRGFHWELALSWPALGNP